MRLTRRRLLTRALQAGALGAAAPLALLPRDDLEGSTAGAPPGPAGTSAARIPPLPAGAPPFAPGELLRYAVAFDGFAAGEAALEVVGPRTIDGKSGLLVRYTAESRGLVRIFYRLSDRIESLLDPLLLFTERYEAWLEQGRRRRHRIVVFEPDEGRVRRTSSGEGATTGPLDGRVVDGLGLIYHLRARPLEPGGRLTVPIYRKERVTAVTLGAGLPTLTETPAGRFETLEVRPIGAAAGADREGSGLIGGSLTVWYTTERRRLPVRLAGRARRGPIDARLRSVRVPPADGSH